MVLWRSSWCCGDQDGACLDNTALQCLCWWEKAGDVSSCVAVHPQDAPGASTVAYEVEWIIDGMQGSVFTQLPASALVSGRWDV